MRLDKIAIGHNPPYDINVIVEVSVTDLGEELGGVPLKLLEEDPLGGDLRERLTVGGTRDRDRHGQ